MISIHVDIGALRITGSYNTESDVESFDNGEGDPIVRIHISCDIKADSKDLDPNISVDIGELLVELPAHIAKELADNISKEVY